MLKLPIENLNQALSPFSNYLYYGIVNRQVGGNIFSLILLRNSLVPILLLLDVPPNIKVHRDGEYDIEEAHKVLGSTIEELRTIICEIDIATGSLVHEPQIVNGLVEGINIMQEPPYYLEYKYYSFESGSWETDLLEWDEPNVFTKMPNIISLLKGYQYSLIESNA